MAWRNARKRLNPPPPSGVPGVPDATASLVKLQSLSGICTLCRASPKNTDWTTLGPQVSDFFRFWADFLPIKNSSKIGLLKNPPRKQSQSVPGVPLAAQSRLFMILASILGPFWPPFLMIFSYFLQKAEIVNML